jgi:hypothetical protein
MTTTIKKHACLHVHNRRIKIQQLNKLNKVNKRSLQLTELIETIINGHQRILSVTTVKTGFRLDHWLFAE